MTPLRFAFGFHLHQPVGNFDQVFEQHVREAYLPFLHTVAERQLLPLSLHLSGPLLEWLESHDTTYLDLVGRLVADRKVELLLAGFYEPILAALPAPDRAEQIGWMREALRRRFGVEATGCWLTERVWEPQLAVDLADAGVRYVVVDDRHFLVAGFERDELHAPFRTESGGRQLAVVPIDERLRYLVPFKPAADTVAYLRELRGRGHRLAVLMDDGEKFGGWPGTREWVFERGWLREFTDAVHALVDAGAIRLSTLAAAVDEVPSAGLAYLPTAAYREMEKWALPPTAAGRLATLEHDLGARRLAGPDGALVRGGHWHNFLVRYPEANRMHKKMVALSVLARLRGNPAGARRAIGRAQCNDAYWHGVFGGLYLPHLRRAVWHNLAAAEAELRREEPLRYELVDLDGDGNEEVWIHSAAFSALISPARGAGIEEYTVFEAGLNYADTLTRRVEAYHQTMPSTPPHEGVRDANGVAGAPSIHELEETLRLSTTPPYDAEDRALFVDRVLPGDVAFDAYARGDYRALQSWAGAQLRMSVEQGDDWLEVSCQAERTAVAGLLEKRLRFDSRGLRRVTYRWDPTGFPGDSVLATEVSLAAPLDLRCTPPAETWSFPIVTMSKSERGLEETVQGSSVTLRWPVRVAEVGVEVESRRAPE